jgi:hypothetical protein
VQLRYGSYLFPANAVAVATDKRPAFDGRGKPVSRRDTFTMHGWLLPSPAAVTPAAAQADLANQCALLERALAVQFADLVMTRDDGGIAFALLNATSIDGVRITSGPNYPTGEGAEFATFRSFSFTAEASYAVAGAASPLVSFQETVTFTGGGPVKDFLQPVNGPPVRQLLLQATPYRATQQGQAVALGGWPTAPGPLWPQALLKNPDLSFASPVFQLGRGLEYPISWAYVFGSAAPLQGRPNRWVGGG